MNLNKLKKVIKSILAIPTVRKTVHGIQLALYRVLSFSRVLAIPYHLIFSRAFDREIFAFTHAIYHYHRKIRGVQGSNVLLRRNIHRLEKGLIMENLRMVFALDYIEETVEAYAMILQDTSNIPLEPGEMQWAHDALSAYFKAVDESHPLIARLRTRFESLPMPKMALPAGTLTPYSSKEREGLQIPWGVSARRS